MGRGVATAPMAATDLVGKLLTGDMKGFAHGVSAHAIAFFNIKAISSVTAGMDPAKGVTEERLQVVKRSVAEMKKPSVYLTKGLKKASRNCLVNL